MYYAIENNTTELYMNKQYLIGESKKYNLVSDEYWRFKYYTRKNNQTR